LALGLLAVMGLFLLFAAGVPLPGLSSSTAEPTVGADAPLAVGWSRDRPHSLTVPDDVRAALGIRRGTQERVAAAEVPTATRPLVLPGSTMLDPTRLMRIRARFAPAEVVFINKVTDRSPSGKTEERELRSGDYVKKGTLLATLYSVDVGSKKNDLIDALVQLKLDEEILRLAERASQAVPEVYLLNARRNVEGDRNAINRALNTLKTWGIAEDDIKALYDEAERIGQRGGRRDRSKDGQWAQVDLRAPDHGTIIECNVSPHEMVVDPTINLFQIARVDRLTVKVDAPEDDLRTLLKLQPRQRYWTIRTSASPEAIQGPIDDIGYLIDVNQHSAVVRGHIDNPGGRLRGGLYVTATIELPPPDDVVEIPMSAIVDDGRQCVVFVQEDLIRPEYTLRRVEVTHRFDQTAFVRKLPADQIAPPAAALALAAPAIAAPCLPQMSAALGVAPLGAYQGRDLGQLHCQALWPGERVLTTGVLELKRELEDRLSKSEP
jgi:cobalt-zinc-cadmium efflux system membrane fusion protein